MPNSWFRFKQFAIHHDRCAHKVGTDGVLLGAWVRASNPLNILDIGSGSGLISLMMALRFANASVTGIELDFESYQQSLENVKASPFANRVSIFQGDFLEYNFGAQQFDLILSNPPFFNQAFLSGHQSRDQARHTAHLSHHHLLQKASALLKDTGSINLILPVNESVAILADTELSLSRKTSVYNKPQGELKRFLLEFKPTGNGIMEESSIAIRNEDGDFSTEYQNLTRHFYLHF